MALIISEGLRFRVVRVPDGVRLGASEVMVTRICRIQGLVENHLETQTANALNLRSCFTWRSFKGFSLSHGGLGR